MSSPRFSLTASRRDLVSLWVIAIRPHRESPRLRLAASRRNSPRQYDEWFSWLNVLRYSCEATLSPIEDMGLSSAVLNSVILAMMKPMLLLLPLPSNDVDLKMASAWPTWCIISSMVAVYRIRGNSNTGDLTIILPKAWFLRSHRESEVDWTLISCRMNGKEFVLLV